MTLTQTRLKERLHYDPDTGIFTKLKGGRGNKVGDIIGNLGNNGYLRCGIDYKIYLMHRLAFLYMMGRFPLEGLEIDHVNRIKTDNRWPNIREVTKAVNSRNNTARKQNKLGVRNVTKINGKYWVAIIRNKIIVVCKSYSTLEEAISARDEFLLSELDL